METCKGVDDTGDLYPSASGINRAAAVVTAMSSAKL